jgi:DNA-binding transcriptional regulator YdaS (Cro superfamily)
MDLLQLAEKSVNNYETRVKLATETFHAVESAYHTRMRLAKEICMAELHRLLALSQDQVVKEKVNDAIRRVSAYGG